VVALGGQSVASSALVIKRPSKISHSSSSSSRFVSVSKKVSAPLIARSQDRDASQMRSSFSSFAVAQAAISRGASTDQSQHLSHVTVMKNQTNVRKNLQSMLMGKKEEEEIELEVCEEDEASGLLTSKISENPEFSNDHSD